MLHLALIARVPVTCHLRGAPIRLAGHRAEVAAGVGGHVDTDVVAAGVIVHVDALPLARESGERHARAAALLQRRAEDVRVRRRKSRKQKAQHAYACPPGEGLTQRNAAHEPPWRVQRNRDSPNDQHEHESVRLAELFFFQRREKEERCGAILFILRRM